MASDNDNIFVTLINGGIITPAEADAASMQAVQSGITPIEALAGIRLQSIAEIMQEFAVKSGIAYLSRIEAIEQELLGWLSPEQAQRYQVLPLARQGQALQIAAAYPLDGNILNSLAHILPMPIEPVLVPQAEITRQIRHYYAAVNKASPSQPKNPDANPVKPTKVTARLPDADPPDAPLLQLVSSILLDAHRLKASDIHLEPLEQRLRLRFRMDGVLQEMRDPPKILQSAILGRLKIMANLNMAEKRLPQDGHITFPVAEGQYIDLRVSTIPTIYGESMVLRLQDQKRLPLALSQLGLLADDLSTMERILSLPDGLFLVTGPTGCGKSTTLYACLNSLNQPDRKLITVEDPIEFDIPGINQVQVNEDAGLGFAAALRALLRQAPNVIMLGEIRDAETAHIAIHAALTGHLVLSTLHTNDAVGAIDRLTDIGIQPFLVAAALRAVLAQRLVRSICPHCAYRSDPTEDELRALKLNSGQNRQAHLTHGKGCEHCRGSGYRGRSGIFEILWLDDELRDRIHDRSDLGLLRQRARELGMRTLREDGIRKVLAGMTSTAEIISTTAEEPQRP